MQRTAIWEERPELRQVRQRTLNAISRRYCHHILLDDLLLITDIAIESTLRGPNAPASDTEQLRHCIRAARCACASELRARRNRAPEEEVERAGSTHRPRRSVSMSVRVPEDDYETILALAHAYRVVPAEMVRRVLKNGLEGELDILRAQVLEAR